MLLAFFLVPLLAFLAIYIFLPQYREKLPILCGITAFISLGAMFYAINSSPLWSDGERLVWSGVKAKNEELIIGGNAETSFVGWANGSFAPKVKAVLDGTQTKLEISGGAGFIRNENNQGAPEEDYLNGEIISATPSAIGKFTFKKTGSFYCGNRLEVLENGNLLVQIKLPSTNKDRVYNLDSVIDRAAQNLTPQGEKTGEWFCAPNYTLSPPERIKQLEALKLSTADSRLLLRKSGEIRLLNTQPTPQPKLCQNPCRLKILWSNSSVLAEFDKSPKDNKIFLKYIPPYRNFSPLPKDVEAKQQLTITNQISAGEYAYTLPLGKKESAEKKKLDLNQISEFVPEPYEKVNQSPCEPPTCKIVEGQNISFAFLRTKDLPSFTKILFFSILPLVLFIAGLGLTNPQPLLKMRCLICGFATIIWNFLVFRLLLAFRYALDPAYLDEHSISDLTLSFGGLIFLPCLLFLLARLRYDSRRPLEEDEAKTLMAKSLVYLAVFFIFFLIEVFYVQTLWSNLPKSFEFSLGFKYTIGILITFLYLLLHIVFLYFYKQGHIWDENSENAVSRVLKFIFYGIWNFPEEFVQISRKVWNDIYFEGTLFKKRLLALAVIYIVFSGIGFLVWGTFGKDFLPFIFCWIPLTFWLSAKSIRVDTDQETADVIKRSWVKILIIALLTFAPFFLLPVVTSDAGSIYANFVIFLTLAFVLFKLAAGSRIFGWISMSFAIFGIVFVFIAYLNFSSFVGWTKNFGEANPRVLAFKRGSDFQHYILSSDAGSNENEIGLNVYDITNVYQHSWENKAIAYEAGLLGFGFGNAPVRLSQVRADTIQYDSVFSFYVVGDYGFIGGIILLLMYFIPLLILYFAGRKVFDVGLSISVIICCAFLLEGLIHAAMNFGVAPLTGRNLPLLSVHSFNGDFLRWAVLFCFLINALYWQYPKDEETDETIVCLLTNERRLLRDSQYESQTDKPTADANGKLPGKVDFLKYYSKRFFRNKSETWLQILCLTMVPAFFFLLIIGYGFFNIYLNKNLEVFSWDILKEDIKWAISNKMIKVVQDEAETAKKCPKIVLDENLYRLKWNDEASNNSFLNQQIHRFNALSCEERIGEGVFPNITENLKAVNSYSGYQEFMNKLRENDEPSRRARKPNLLAVQRLSKELRGNDNLGFAVIFNPEFNIQRTFNEPNGRENIPNVKIGNETNLLGAAWDKGKYVIALDNPQILPWTDWLAGAMSLEWKRLGNKEAAQKYGKLSLNLNLHKQALKFIDQKGIELHKKKLSTGINNFEDKIPPRIGLTVMKLTGGNDNGEILALGGFPRSIAGNQWQKLSYGTDTLWLPPTKIVEKRFPGYLRQLYGGDRNFEKVTVMGSSTKPMWAQAATAVNPNLSLTQNFRVAGSAVDDDSIFGIKIADDKDKWKGHGSKQKWVDFNTFLTESNNRYQVLYGFLGLVESKPEQNILPYEQNASGSLLESMNGASAWKKFPKFDEQIGFNSKFNYKTDELKNLHKTPLAIQLRRLFGVSTFERESSEQKEDYSSYMNSFWTKNENHDALRTFEKEPIAPANNIQIQNNFPPAIIPARANFQLNRITKPRDFVTLLLGGGENQWSNVHATAGFASVVIGKPILPHIVENNDEIVFYGREKEFFQLAEKVRIGLDGVVFKPNGTANSTLGAGAVAILQSLKKNGFQVYAKTGTLTEDGINETSRLILAIVKFEDADKTKIKKGLVFSLFVEETEQGTASTWLGEFIMENKGEIAGLLDTQISDPTPLQPQNKKGK